MKIINQATIPALVFFTTLNIGDVFECKEQIFMKTKISEGARDNCIRLVDGHSYRFFDLLEPDLKKLEVEIHITH